MLFGSTLLEVGIGMIFVYLLLSLLCSALNELIESFIKFRARYLEKGIVKLLNDKDLAAEFFDHPLVKPLGDKPSYIPARTFSLALWNIASTKAAQGQAAAAGVSQDLAAIRATVAGMQEDDKLQYIGKALLTLIDEAGGDINKARANVEQWYNDAMDRVSGWYKRRTHWILVVLGLLAALAFNVDSITVVKGLWFNDALRTSLVAAAEDYAKANPAPTPAAPGAPTPTPLTPEQQAAEARQKISTITGQFNSLNLPVGWPVKPDPKSPKYNDASSPAAAEAARQQFAADMLAYNTDPRWPAPSENGGGLVLKLLGIVITALAVSQGAPFWFDLLNKFIVIRSTVKPREKSQPQPSKDRPAPETTAPAGGGEDGEGEAGSKD
jgi:hypothetical protein